MILLLILLCPLLVFWKICISDTCLQWISCSRPRCIYIHPRSLFWRFGKTEKSEHHNTLFKGIIQNMCNNILCKKNRKKIISNRIFAATSRKCRQGTHTHRLARRRRQKEMTRTDTVDASRCRHYTTLYFTDWKYKMTVSIKPSRSLWEFIFLLYVLMQYLH